MLRRVLLSVVVVLLVALAAGAVFVAARQNLRFEAPYPEIAASTDSAVVARGEYLMSAVTDCASCHGDPAQKDAIVAGEHVPLVGGHTWDIPPGRFRARNITPDSATGIGAIPDRALARALRYGVGHDGRALLPFMELQGLSDEDLTAIVSYLRRQEPVRHEVPDHEFSLLGKVVRATLLSQPTGPASPPPAVSPRGATVENGRYLAESVSLCWACHTERDMVSGRLVGPRYGGAPEFHDANNPARVWAPPNLTKDPQTGVLGRMSEDEFVARFRAGRLLEGSPMPWPHYARMSEDDLRAIYRYLESLPPVTRDVGPPVREVAAK